MKSTTPIRDLTAAAREGLVGNWGKSIGATLLYLILLIGVSLVPSVGGLLQLIFSAPLTVGLTLYFLTIVRRQNSSSVSIFDGFGRFGTAFCTYLLVSLIILICMLPFSALCFLLFALFKHPGFHLLVMLAGFAMMTVIILLQMRYSLALYVVADDPSVRARQAIRRGVELLKGNYWRLGLLWLRFTGWILLGFFTLGIGFIWLAPYYMAALTAFYDDLAKRSSDQGGQG